MFYKRTKIIKIGATYEIFNYRTIIIFIFAIVSEDLFNAYFSFIYGLPSSAQETTYW